MSTFIIDLEWLVEHGSCYFDEAGNPVNSDASCWATRLPVEVRELAAMCDIPIEDRLWVLYQLMSRDQRRQAARHSARACIGEWVGNVPAVVRQWLRYGSAKYQDQANRLIQDTVHTMPNEDSGPTAKRAHMACRSASWTTWVGSSNGDYPAGAPLAAWENSLKARANQDNIEDTALSYALALLDLNACEAK